MKGKYDDIIHLPHPDSKNHPRMSLHDRAAQFSPFAALTGHHEAIDETARLTEQKLELSEEQKAELDMHWQYLLLHGAEQLKVQITYFIHDEKKEGGFYRTVQGIVKKIDPYQGYLYFKDGTSIYYNDIYEVEMPDRNRIKEIPDATTSELW